MPEAARTKVDSYPRPAQLIREQIDEVVARSDRPELGTGLVLEVPDRGQVPGGGVKEGMVHFGLVFASDPKRNTVPDVVHDLVDARLHILGGDVQQGCPVPTPHIVAHDSRRYMRFIGNDAADRHPIAFVSVRAKRRAHHGLVLGGPPDLRESRLVMRPKNLNLIRVHHPSVPCRASADGRRLSVVRLLRHQQ